MLVTALNCRPPLEIVVIPLGQHHGGAGLELIGEAEEVRGLVTAAGFSAPHTRLVVKLMRHRRPKRPWCAPGDLAQAHTAVAYGISSS
jgi:hypothetical protein